MPNRKMVEPHTYLVVGFCDQYVEQGFEYEFKTKDEAEQMAMKILDLDAKTSVRIYKAQKIFSGSRDR